MKIVDKIKYSRYIKTAREVARITTGCGFSDIPKYKDGDFVICPMQSGKKGLFRMSVSTPHDPGDQHFYEHEFLCYIDQNTTLQRSNHMKKEAEGEL